MTDPFSVRCSLNQNCAKCSTLSHGPAVSSRQCKPFGASAHLREVSVDPICRGADDMCIGASSDVLLSLQLSVRNMMVDSTWASAAASYIDIYTSVAAR
jgi:hypothetical protein